MLEAVAQFVQCVLDENEYYTKLRAVRILRGRGHRIRGGLEC